MNLEASDNSYMMSQSSWDIPESPDTLSPYYMSPVKGKLSNPIDQSKIKTKMCRNYQLGLPCPFEDRCAFVHGPVIVTKTSTVVALAPPPPPPSYTDALQTAWNSNSDSFNDSPVSSPRMESPPPAYPQKFRYDPYHPQGIVYEN